MSYRNKSGERLGTHTSFASKFKYSCSHKLGGEILDLDNPYVVSKKEKDFQTTGTKEITAPFLLCQLIQCLINNDEKLQKARQDFLNLNFDARSQKQFSPVQLFQRIDRAGKGYLTRKDILSFLAENGFKPGSGWQKSELKLIFKN